jgi:hypothetical protein
LITRSTRPRTRAGMSSSIAELIAAYSLPILAPVKKRATKNRAVEHERGQEQLLAPEPMHAPAT